MILLEQGRRGVAPGNKASLPSTSDRDSGRWRRGSGEAIMDGNAQPTRAELVFHSERLGSILSAEEMMSRAQASALTVLVTSIVVMIFGMFTYVGKGPLAEPVDFEYWMERSGGRKLAADDPALKKVESNALLAMVAARLRNGSQGRGIMSCAGCLFVAGLAGGGWANRRAEARHLEAAGPPPSAGPPGA